MWYVHNDTRNTLYFTVTWKQGIVQGHMILEIEQREKKADHNLIKVSVDF